MASLSLNPVKYVRFLARVARYSQAVKGKTDLTFAEQVREVYQLLRINRLEPREYYEVYELFHPELTWEEKKRFLSRNQFAVLDRELNPVRSTGILNKLAFKVFAEHFNLPVARWYGLFDTGFGYTLDGKPLRTAADLEKLLESPELTSFLFKPISSDKALGIISCARQAGTLQIHGVGTCSVADLYEMLRETHHSGNRHVRDSWLIEERIRQHEWFDRFSETYCHHYRIVTFLTSEGKVEVLGAGMGIGRKGFYLHQSGPLGLSAGINDEGLLTAAVCGGEDGIEFHDRHPETSALITGQRPPMLEESIAVACRAHKCLPHLRLLGWDVAPTSDGPLIFEGNSYWNWEKFQRANRRGVIRNSLAQELPKILSS